jgi:nicotinate-nucleotide--dimethylbenzimidazole phosphoribosyltransferase
MIPKLDPSIGAAARERVDQLTKPVGSLGRIEDLAVRLCAIAGGLPKHCYERRAVLVAAADHGVAAEGVSAYPSEVTAQMVGGFCAGTAAVSAFARMARADVYVADFGVDAELAPHPALFNLKIARGSANFARGPAMPPAHVDAALAAGRRAFEMICALSGSPHILALGDMGIANTTSAAALIAAFTGTPAGLIVGRGTGVNDQGFARKVGIVERAVANLNRREPAAIASRVGGYEIVGLAGAMLAAAAARTVVLLDGFIVAAAALLAAALDEDVKPYMLASHRSKEPGHQVALRKLGLEPLFDLDLRLGEATGAVLAIPLIEAAARMICEMKTFAEAGVSTAETPALL